MGSWKLESGVNKEDVREKKRGDSKKKKNGKTWMWNYDHFNFWIWADQ